MAVQIAHAVRIDAAAPGVDRLSPLVAGDHVFLAAYPARVSVAVETTPVGNRNCERDPPSSDGSQRHRSSAGDQQSRHRRERDTNQYFGHFATGRIAVRMMIVV